jgi:hypothetical protein
MMLRLQADVLATRMKLAAASLLVLVTATAAATTLPLPDEASRLGGWYDSRTGGLDLSYEARPSTSSVARGPGGGS